MSVNLPLLLVGLFLLWFPRQWMRLGPSFGVRHRKQTRPRWRDEPWNRQITGSPNLSFAAEFTKIRNYFDLLRAAGGGLAIMGGYAIVPALTVAEGAAPLAARQVTWIDIGILVVAVLAQTVRVERGHLSFFAPIFFMAGLSLCLTGHWGAFFAFSLIWAMNPMLPSAQAFLTLYALLLGAFTLLYRGLEGGAAFLIASLGFLPVLLSLLTKRRLGVLKRRAPHQAGE
ncbi:MAG: hypothetical protein WD941_06780 [Opitutus sp.]